MFSLGCSLLGVFLTANFPHLVQLQSSAIITRSNVIEYYINDYRNWGRISIRCWIHKRLPIPHPNGVFCGYIYLWENWQRYNSTVLYQNWPQAKQAKSHDSHFLYQWWPNATMPYDVTKPQWVNTIFITDRQVPKDSCKTNTIGKVTLVAFISTTILFPYL